ncbi:hypothetical protein BLA29_002422 [Euroglyphus maynei]|uniref:Uncharacterized protein n=1 Tax=Euroglyphus maynei TaxID=6958 RepID=A0A1Y3AR34_EURMA|nr:hypothetical protein BLA29_002422 [Euroglyphus maynei]
MGQEMFDECQQRLLEARQSIKKEDPMELFVQFRVGKALRMMRRLRDESSSSSPAATTATGNDRKISEDITNGNVVAAAVDHNNHNNHCNAVQG